MSRLAATSWRRLVCVFEGDGFEFKKRSGKGTSHWIGTKQGVPRPVVVPEYDEVGLDIINANRKTAGMSRKHYLELLAAC